MPLYDVSYYNQRNYIQYIEKRRKENIEVVTFPFLEIYQNQIDDLFEEGEFDLDLTSAAKIIANNETITYFLEKIICILDNGGYGNINFIIDEKYIDVLLRSSPYFSKGEAIEVEDNETNESMEKEIVIKKRIVDNSNFEELQQYLNENLIGHKSLKKNLIEELKVYEFFNQQIKDQPIFSLFLLGPSGTGKTEIGRTLHRYLDKKTPVAKINLANYKSESSLSSLIGSPPGYIGSNDESDLVRKIKTSNTGLLIIDEFEKADGAIHNFFLQLLEEGKFDDAMGNIHDLDGYIIVFTSNFSRNDFLKDVPSELRSRFNLVTECTPLDLKHRKEYLEKVIKEYNLNIDNELSDEDIEEIIQKIKYKDESNLRNLRKVARKEFYNYVNKD
ncbi:hypothetical protein BTJ45_01926 [Bacillus mycoides]|nr:hypothetical protein BTJ45_01926 [Bacillus mycoides]